MDIIECKNIIRNYFNNKGDYQEHQDNQQLMLNGKKYRIQPDDTYIFEDRVVAIEYEKNKRPVESISKYWWLFYKTDWESNNIKMNYFILIIRHDLNEIREESIIILGDKLQKDKKDKFSFFYLSATELSEKNIKNILNQL